MTSLAAAIVLASLLAQPPAAPTADKPAATPPPPATAPTPLPPAPVASAAAAGPWVIGEAKYYHVDENAEELVTSPDNPGNKTERKSTGSYTVKFVPRKLDAAGGKQAFELTVVGFKLNVPTPIGEMKVDSTAAEDPKDQVSVQFGKVMKRIIGVPVTVNIEGGKVTEVTGNEALVDPKATGAAIISTFFSDTAICERFAYCVTTGSAGAKLEPGATWPIDAKVEFRRLMAFDLPATATVKGAKDGLVTITLTPGAAGKMTRLPAADALGKGEGAVKENHHAGELVWSAGENRLLSGAYTAGYTVTFDLGRIKGEQRSVRTLKVVRADAPSAK